MSVSTLSISFTTELCFDPDETILRVSGDVDLLTAGSFQAVMGSVVERAHSSLMIDLAGITFMDASGLGAIAATIQRLRDLGGALTIRSAPANTMRLLELSGLAGLIEFDDAHDLSSDVARLGSMPLSDQVVDTALRLVTTLASVAIEGADGVSVSLRREGHLVTIAASNRTVGRMDDHQYETGEGPCISAATEGQRFHIGSLQDEARWPAFVPRAVDEGIASILSTPLMAVGNPLGALNIYSNTAGAFGPGQQELASLFAEQASGVLVDAGVEISRDVLAVRVSAGLVSRDIITRAQGILMERDHLASHAAAAALHREARAAGVSVLERATIIVRGVTTDG